MANSEVGKLTIGLELDGKKYNKDLQNAEKSTKKFSEIARETILTNIVNNAFNAVTGAISNTISKMSEFAASTVEVGKTFDSSMSNVAAISGAAGNELTALRDKAKEMGAATKFTATEAADAMSYMAMAGWKTEQMLNGVSGVMNLAAASGADLAEASDIVTDALTAFGQSAAESGRLADIMAAASANSNTNVHLLGETFKYVAPVAGALKYSMEDTAVAIGLMANSGIKGSQAGTALRATLTNLASPTDTVMEAMGALGISITDAGGQVKPFSKLMEEMRGSFSKLNEVQKTSYASMIAGKEAMSGFLAIVNASDADFQQLTNAINNSSGAAEKMAFTMIDNLAGAQELVRSKAESLKLSLYEGVEPALTAVTKSVGAMITALMGSEGGMDILNASIDEMLTNFSTVANTLPAMIQDMAGRIPEIIQAIVPRITDIALMMINAFSTVIPSVIEAISSSAPTIISSIITVLSQLITTLIGMTPQLIEMVLSMITSLIQAISDNLPMIIDKIVETIPKIVNALTTQLPLLISAGVQLFMTLVQAIPQIIPPLIDALPQIIDTIINILLQNLPVIIQGAIQLFMAILKALPTIIQKLGEALPQILNSITEFLTNGNTIGMILDAALQMLDAIIEALPQIIEALANALPDILTALVSFLTNPATITQLLDAAIQLFQALVQAVPRILGALIGAFGTLVGSLWESIKGMFGAFASNFGNFIGGIFKAAINGVLGFIENIINGPIDIINGFIGTINSAFGFIGVNLGTIPRVNLPRLAQGGYADGATAAIFGEAGKEVALPLERNTDNWSGLLAAALAEEFEMGEVAGGGDRPIENTQNIYINDKMDIRKVGNAFLQEIRRV